MKRTTTSLALLGWLAAPFAAPPLAASDISFSYAALERALWSSLMTEGGRHYLEGGPEDDCRYAFLQEPRVDAVEGRLRFRFVFSGRAGVGVKGRCVGPGDTFELQVTGRPSVAGGELLLEDPQVSAPDSPYFRLVSGLVERRLAESLRFPLRRSIELALAAASSGVFRLALRDLRVAELEAGPESLRVSYAATLDVY